MITEICPKCGSAMIFDDHVSIGYEEWDTARLYLCDNEECGYSHYEPYAPEEAEKVRINFCRRIMDSDLSRWFVTIGLTSDNEYKGLSARYSVFSATGWTAAAEGMISVNSRHTLIHPYYPIEHVSELVEIDLWSMMLQIKRIAPDNKNVAVKISEDLDLFLRRVSADNQINVVQVKDKILNSLNPQSVN